MSNSGKLANLLVAAKEWQHASWEEGYYPEDIPAEWRLGYYANEFRAVLAEPPPGTEEVAAWLDDVDEDFGFCLDLRQSVADSSALAAFKQQLLGVLATHLPDTIPDSVAIFSETQESDISLPNSRQSRVFDDIRSSGMRLCLYRAEPDLSLVGLREDIEVLLASVPPESCCIMVWCDEPPPVEIMRQAKMIAELLGA
jgi:hypothetical protein